MRTPIMCLVLTLLLVAPSAQAAVVTFDNAITILIPSAGTSGNASPYPSVISVVGMSGLLTDLEVILNGLSHTWPEDIDILLVAPGGSLTALVMSDVGGGGDVSGITLTIDDDAASPLPDGTQLSSGTYRPADYIHIGSDTFTGAPAGPWGATLSVFNGIDPNGDWSLYIVDDSGADSGSLANGWSLRVTTNDAAIPEPSTLVLLGAGLAGLALARRRRL